MAALTDFSVMRKTPAPASAEEDPAALLAGAGWRQPAPDAR